MKFLKRFFRRVIYRCSSRLLRFIIFFHLFVFSLSLFTFAANSYTFDNFTDFVADGTLEYNLGTTGGGTVKYGTLSNINFDDITFAYNFSDSFDTCDILIFNSSNVKRTVSGSNNVFIFDIKMLLVLDPGVYDLDVIKENFEIFADRFRSYGEDCITDIYQEQKDTFTNIYIDIHVNEGIPYLAEEYIVDTLGFRFANLSSSSYRMRIYPSRSKDIIYYIGPEDSAPTFPSFPDDSVNELDDLEKEALEQFDFKSAFDEFFNPINSLFNNLYLTRSFAIIADMFSLFLARVPFVRYILYFSISLGLFAFVFNIASSLIGSSERGFKKQRSDKPAKQGG